MEAIVLGDHRQERGPRDQSDHLPVLSEGRAEVDRVRFPDLTDLMSRLRFSTTDGRIWLDDQRMLLIHAKAFGAFRREMIETLGLDVARGFFTRMGYHAGTSDAQMARRVRSKAPLKDMFLVGPQMHCLEGIGLSEPVRLDFDIEKGTHYGEFVWTHQVEDEEHVRYFQIGTEPSCWMQIGYASGYSTEFMGMPILYREVECQSMGQAACRIVGKPLTEWDEEAADEMRFLTPDDGAGQPMGKAFSAGTKLASLPSLEGAEAGVVVGISPGFNSALNMVRRVATTNATVLFLGESGVGKEVFARALHRLSARSDKPFVAVNCVAIPEELIESELFGAERGAYTGATQSREGRFERADGGTLFLDEIGSLSADAQGKLLRALQEGEIERLGGTQSRKVDVRVVAATNVDLREEVSAHRFREDLFYRLNVFPIHIAPLRERREDIPLLLNYFLQQFNRLHGKQLTGFTQRAVDAIMTYGWPGNVRELRNVIERGFILAHDTNVIDTPQLFTDEESFEGEYLGIDPEGQLVSHSPSDLLRDREPRGGVDEAYRSIENLLKGGEAVGETLSLDEIETVLLAKAVERTDGNVAAAARLLGITRPQMVYRLKRSGIDPRQV